MSLQAQAAYAASIARREPDVVRLERETRAAISAAQAREYRQRTGQDYALASRGEGGEWPLDNWGNSYAEREAEEGFTEGDDR